MAVMLDPENQTPDFHAALDVVCLCAGWCRSCDEYALVFQQLQRALPRHRFRWIDIEDEADLVGEVDVETFPTLLIAQGGRVLFAGPVLPRLVDAQRLVEASVSQVAHGGAVAPLAGLPADQWRAFEALAQAL